MAAHSALNGPRVRAFEYAGPDFEVSAVGIMILAHTYLNNPMKGTVENRVPGLKVNYAFSIYNKATRLNFKSLSLITVNTVVGHY